MFWKLVRSSFVILTFFTILTGLVYPLVVTGIAQVVFPRQANGSLIAKKGSILGSELIGQPFSDPKYFWSRPSATSPFAYNAGASSGSNLGPLNPALLEVVNKRLQDLKAVDPENTRPVPVDLVTASASGLDPHISVAAALYQIDRVARFRKMNPEQVHALLDRQREGRQLGSLGEPCVNVLALNLALDDIQTQSEAK